MAHRGCRPNRLITSTRETNVATITHMVSVPKSSEFKHLGSSRLTTHTALWGQHNPPLRIYDDDGVTLAEPPADLNYFELFDIPETFDLDARSLQRTFRQLQSSFHPDRHVNKSPRQKDMAERWSIETNRGYSRLLRPLERALYLLELRGRPIGEDDAVGDVSFLAEVMEANEEVAEAESLADLAGISEHNKRILEDYAEAVSAAFAEDRVDKAKEVTTRMRYYCNLQDKIADRELEMGKLK